MSGFVRGKLLVILLGLSVVFSPLSAPGQSSRTIPNRIAALIGNAPNGAGDWKPDKGARGDVEGGIGPAASATVEPL
ncbi:MAG TPA: hypothetical protein VM347_34505 [Nonomuraea sp.]|nr:hypothetical protein [Nonomuraea sp.]